MEGAGAGAGAGGHLCVIISEESRNDADRQTEFIFIQLKQKISKKKM